MRAFKWSSGDQVKIKRNGENRLGCCCGCSSATLLNVDFDGVGTSICSQQPDSFYYSASIAPLTTYGLPEITPGELWGGSVTGGVTYYIHGGYSNCDNPEPDGPYTANLNITILCLDGSYLLLAEANFFDGTNTIVLNFFNGAGALNSVINNESPKTGTATIYL